MKIFTVFAFCLLWVSVAGVAKQRHCTFRVHAQANPRDTEVFSTSVHAQVSGKEIAIEGKLTTRNYTDKEGIKRYITEIVAHEFLFIGGKADKN